MNIEVATVHPLETKRFLCPNGSHFVELVDASEETWEKYCAMLAANCAPAARLSARDRRENNYSKCPACGYFAFNGVECFDCGYRAETGRF